MRDLLHRQPTLAKHCDATSPQAAGLPLAHAAERATPPRVGHLYFARPDVRVRQDVLMSAIQSSDPDFRVCQIGFERLLEIQAHAERSGWGTRWSSEGALRTQVREKPVLLCPILREEWDGDLRAYRCLALFAIVDGTNAAGIATIDVDPGTFESIERLDHDPAVSSAFARIFELATGGISHVAKA